MDNIKVIINNTSEAEVILKYLDTKDIKWYNGITLLSIPSILKHLLYYV